jgi:hypothetical protein
MLLTRIGHGLGTSLRAAADGLIFDNLPIHLSDFGGSEPWSSYKHGGYYDFERFGR